MQIIAKQQLLTKLEDYLNNNMGIMHFTDSKGVTHTFNLFSCDEVEYSINFFRFHVDKLGGKWYEVAVRYWGWGYKTALYMNECGNFSVITE